MRALSDTRNAGSNRLIDAITLLVIDIRINLEKHLTRIRKEWFADWRQVREKCINVGNSEGLFFGLSWLGTSPNVPRISNGTMRPYA